MWLEDKCY
uniref:Uncharacterized protein n=1 Tax=Anguilla anguilla TaxID=7936 RepID=A0A0E9UUD2_ANGAN